MLGKRNTSINIHTKDDKERASEQETERGEQGKAGKVPRDVAFSAIKKEHY